MLVRVCHARACVSYPCVCVMCVCVCVMPVGMCGDDVRVPHLALGDASPGVHHAARGHLGRLLHQGTLHDDGTRTNLGGAGGGGRK